MEPQFTTSGWSSISRSPAQQVQGLRVYGIGLPKGVMLCRNWVVFRNNVSLHLPLHACRIMLCLHSLPLFNHPNVGTTYSSPIGGVSVCLRNGSIRTGSEPPRPIESRRAADLQERRTGANKIPVDWKPPPKALGRIYIGIYMWVMADVGEMEISLASSHWCRTRRCRMAEDPLALDINHI